jgi:NAD(P)-dependent dehydrogenase (short-subunit alcohol dehydrogenase family)
MAPTAARTEQRPIAPETAMDLELEGRRALVSGGSRGIGKAVARALAREGVDVALLARDLGRLNAAATELSQETGRRIVGVAADTRDDAAVDRACAEAAAALGGPIQILVNAAADPAGYAAPPRLAEITSALFARELDTKGMGYLRTARAVAPAMKAVGWGRMVHISGLAARQTGNLIGSVRNVAVAALSKNLADELGPYGITVNCVHPGTTQTERTADLVAARARAERRSEDDVRASLAAANSIRHLVDASEVAHVVAFLCSPKALAINGEVIAVGGGAPRSIHY